MRKTLRFQFVLFFILFIVFGSLGKAAILTSIGSYKSMVDSVLAKGLTFSQIGEASAYGEEFTKHCAGVIAVEHTCKITKIRTNIFHQLHCRC